MSFLNYSDADFRQARLSRDVRFDGLFFICVKTTGIFCRPICPAVMPKEEHVEYVQMAHQAISAGYRPCLRCRPDSAPHSYAWKGVQTTLERGMALLKIHPQLQVTEIAKKLGISERYLRQLFNQHLGISPKQYQLYEQLLFAKQLLHQSHLSVESVAQAVGFQSSRRLQANLNKVTRLTPRQIRRHSAKLTTNIQIKLAYRPPYAWQQVRDFLAIRAVKGMEQVTENSYSRTFSFNQAKGYFHATFCAEEPVFNIELTLDKVSQLKGVVENIRRILDLDADSQLIRQQLKRAGVREDHIINGLRLPGIWDPFEAGCRAILGQQVSVKAAVNLVNQLVQQLGKKQENMFLFPDAQAVAEDELTFLKMPNSRRQALRAFASYLAQQPTSDLQTWLSIKGVGPWTVAYAQLRGQSNSDIWLDTDLVIKKACQQFQLEPAAAAPWRSYLTFQLWSLQ